MRSLTLDAALVAMPSLAAAGIAVQGGAMLVERAAREGWASPPFADLPLLLALGYLLAWILYLLSIGLVEHRALSTSTGRGLFLALAALAIGVTALDDGALALRLAAAAAGAALALRAARRRPSRRDRPGLAQAPLQASRLPR